MKKKEGLTLGLLVIMDLLWICFILSRSMKTADASSVESLNVLELLRRLMPGITMHTVRKLAHFTEFLILGGLLTLTASAAKLPAWLPVPAGLAVAVCDELIQLRSPGRSCQITDILLDLFGVICGWQLCRLVQRLAARRRNRDKGEGEHHGR